MGDLQQLIDFIQEEHGLNVLAVMPCHQAEVPDFETVWVVSGSPTDPSGRKIYLVLGSKTVSEAAGPPITDCPPHFFELATTVVNQQWRDACLQ